MPNDTRNTILETIETALAAQLRAVKKLRIGSQLRPRRERLSRPDMAYDILRKAGHPLHISQIIERIQAVYGVKPGRDSLTSQLAKKAADSVRFVRTDKNTFSLKED